LTNLDNLNSLNENLNPAKSLLKNLDFKNLNQEKKYDLNRRENLNTLKKLVSTLRTVSISILIGQAYNLPFSINFTSKKQIIISYFVSSENFSFTFWVKLNMFPTYLRGNVISGI